MRQVELAGPLALRAPLEQKLSVGRRLQHPIVPVPVAKIEQTVLPDGNIAGTVVRRGMLTNKLSFTQHTAPQLKLAHARLYA